MCLLDSQPAVLINLCIEYCLDTLRYRSKFSQLRERGGKKDETNRSIGSFKKNNEPK